MSERTTKNPTSKTFADAYKHSQTTGKPFQSPSILPLDHARNFYPFPVDFTDYDYEEPLKWIWLQIRFDRQTIMSCSAALCLLLAFTMFVTFASRKNTVVVILGALFVFAGFVFTWIRVNMAINENHRRAVCHAFGRAVQAKNIWKPHESEQIYAKDLFYEETTSFGKLQVLRDGTTLSVPARIPEEGNNLLKRSVDIGGGAGGGEGLEVILEA